jgi:hypothetical protein
MSRVSGLPSLFFKRRKEKEGDVEADEIDVSDSFWIA